MAYQERMIVGLFALVLFACGTPQQDAATTTSKQDTVRTTAVVTANGPQVIHLKDGGRLEGELRNGERIGPWTSYHPNGKVWSRSTYVDGLEEGPTEVFQDNGLPFYTGTYHNGKPSGEWVFYDNMGQETKRVLHDSAGVVMR